MVFVKILLVLATGLLRDVGIAIKHWLRRGVIWIGVRKRSRDCGEREQGEDFAEMHFDGWRVISYKS